MDGTTEWKRTCVRADRSVARAAGEAGRNTLSRCVEASAQDSIDWRGAKLWRRAGAAVAE